MGCRQSSAESMAFDSSGHVQEGSLQDDTNEESDAANAFQNSSGSSSRGYSRRRGASRYAVASTSRNEEEHVEESLRVSAGKDKNQNGGGFYTNIGDFEDQSSNSKSRRSRRRRRRQEDEEMVVTDDLKNFAQSLKSGTSKSRAIGGTVIIDGRADLLPGQRLGNFIQDHADTNNLDQDEASSLAKAYQRGFIPEPSFFEDDDPLPL